MDSLVGYGSDDDNETDRYGSQSMVGAGCGSSKRRDDDTNYDDVNMDMSEDSQGAESEPELPPAEPSSSSRHSSREDRRASDDSGDRSRDRSREYERRDRRRESPARRDRDRDADRRNRRDDRHRADRSDRRYDSGSRRGLLGDRPDDRSNDSKVPALMDLKPFGGEPPPADRRSHDARDATSPRFREDRDRRDRDKDRERDRDRHSRRSEERRGGSRRERSRSRGAAYPPPTPGSSERRGSSPGDYRPSSYKVNRKLEVMEKMGLQIKTPAGWMASARELRAAAGDAPYAAPAARILHQVQKRKLLWSNKSKSEAEEAAKWSGAKFSQDNDGKQASKFMRLMGIKQPAAVKAEATDKSADTIKKQDELFQAMQAQYEVARATTHTMRGVGLGFQRGQY